MLHEHPENRRNSQPLQRRFGQGERDISTPGKRVWSSRRPAAATGKSILYVVLALVLMAAPLASNASAAVYRCANLPISIKAEEKTDPQHICNSAGDALAFFDRLNVKLTHPVLIEVVMALPGSLGESAVGCYQHEEQKVSVLGFPAFSKRKTWFGVAINQAMYRSLVTHEVAHAVARCNFAVPEPTLHAEEYVAYVAMFSMMDPVLRAQILAANPGEGFESASEINELTYAFYPMRFGVQAYRHYRRKEHGDEFLLKVLSGNVLTNSVLDLP